MTLPIVADLEQTFKGLLEQYKISLEINPTKFSLLSLVAIDVEHDEEGGLVGIGAYDGEHSYYWTTNQIGGWINEASIICHNGITDFDCLRYWGIPVKDTQLVWDTYLMGHIIDSSLKAYGLKDMAKRELEIEYPAYKDLVGKGKNKTTLDKLPVSLVAMYNAMDVYATYKLWEKQRNGGIVKSPCVHYFESLEKPVSQVFHNMENRGMRVDLEYLERLKIDLESKKLPIELEIKNELEDINLNSPKQLLEALNAKEIFPTLKGKPSTDKRALSAYQDSGIVRALLQYSELDTLLSSFVNPYLERNVEVVHPFFNQCGTRTGRPSCSNPNLLQIPRRTENGKLVRRMFIPREGMRMGDCDYGQIEPRVLAHLSKDPTLCGLFNEGIDFHTYTSERLGIDRDKAKILNLSVGYRATYKSVSSQLKCTDTEAQNEINKWWNLFPALRRWQDCLIFESKRSGFCTTLLGRRIRVDELSTGNKWRREGAERQLINNITQASAAEIMKKAMIDINETAPNLGLLVQVYDELLFESPYIEDALPFVIDRMEKAIKLDVPLTVEGKSGDSWSQCH